jgi:hypothetical protein
LAGIQHPKSEKGVEIMNLGKMTIKVKLDKETIDRLSEIKSSLEDLTKKINLLLDANNSED